MRRADRYRKPPEQPAPPPPAEEESPTPSPEPKRRGTLIPRPTDPLEMLVQMEIEEIQGLVYRLEDPPRDLDDLREAWGSFVRDEKGNLYPAWMPDQDLSKPKGLSPEERAIWFGKVLDDELSSSDYDESDPMPQKLRITAICMLDILYEARNGTLPTPDSL